MLTSESDSNVNTSEEDFPWRRAWTAAVLVFMAAVPLAWASVGLGLEADVMIVPGALGLGASALLLWTGAGLVRGRPGAWDTAVFLLSLALVPAAWWVAMAWSSAVPWPQRLQPALPVAYVALALGTLLSCRDAWDRSTRR